MAVAKLETSLDTQEMFRTIPFTELFHSQREVAQYLHLGYLHLADYPDVASEVRMTAHAARSQHLLAIGLMKKFKTTTNHILSVMIPMMLNAVELQDKDIIVEVFKKVIDSSEGMKTESEKTRDSYINIQTKVQESMSSVSKKNKEVKDKRISIEHEMEAVTLRDNAEKLALEELEKEKKQYEENLKTLKEQQAESFKLYQEAGRNMTAEDEKKASATFLDQLNPTAAMGALGQAFDVAGKTVNLITNIYEAYKKADTHKQLMKGYEAADDRVQRAQKENLAFVDRMNQKRKEANERHARMSVLCQENVNLANVESLREASGHLGLVDKQFTRIILFWGNMATVLKYLKDDVNAGDVYLNKIEKPAYAELFKQSIARDQEGWTLFESICSQYVFESQVAIETLYDFLSAPIDSMSAEQVQQRKDRLLKAIKSDITSTYGEEK